MSLIPLRYRCPECDGYVGDDFKRLKFHCKCPEPVNEPVMTGKLEADYLATRERFLARGLYW